MPPIDDTIVMFIRWASSEAIISAILKSEVPICDLQNLDQLKVRDVFAEKLKEFLVEIQDATPDLLITLQRLKDIDDRIVIVTRVSDNNECVAPKDLVLRNIGSTFERRGLFGRRTFWNNK